MIFKNRKYFYLFISPWLLGFVLLTIGPMLFSLYLSFHNWDMLTERTFVGFQNYTEIFTDDPLFIKSLINTFIWAAFLPLGIILSLLVASLLNTKIKGIGVYRTIFYLPVIVPAVAMNLLWLWLYNPEVGLINGMLDLVGLPTSKWLLSETMVIPALVIMSLWQLGANVLIFLAALQGVPEELYEAADLDGASKAKRFFRITIPLISPAIFFQLIVGMIAALQIFTQGYLMTNGGPNNRTLFYMLYLYRTAFENFQMGYASALSWIIFIITVLITMFIFKYFNKRVHYG